MNATHLHLVLNHIQPALAPGGAARPDMAEFWDPDRRTGSQRHHCLDGEPWRPGAAHRTPLGRGCAAGRCRTKSRIEERKKSMKTNRTKTTAMALSLTAFMFLVPNRALAHCDTMDGPVVKAAQKALAERNVDLVLLWVQKTEEPEIK